MRIFIILLLAAGMAIAGPIINPYRFVTAGGGSPPTFDTASSGQTNVNNNLTVSHTCTGTGTDGILLVFIGQGNTTTPASVSSVTYNSVAMTAIPSFTASDGNWVHVTGYYLLLPATGTHSIVVTFGSTVQQIAVGGMSFTGVNQTTPLGTAVGNAGSTAGPATVTVSSSTSEIVACGVFTDATTIAVGTGTSRWEQENINSDTSGGGSTVTGASSVTPTWSLTGTVDNGWAIGAVSVKGL